MMLLYKNHSVDFCWLVPFNSLLAYNFLHINTKLLPNFFMPFALGIAPEIVRLASWRTLEQ
jgi:hypothetical protein